ncbi:class I SAM-dependent methyltransferase [Variovorax sp. OV329]|uniref:class I SAM-dependent methyltransferase n=1 Tax=Variovorax sp. OV329 TaxID=1882825 RepID=UPI0008E0F6B6|nr:class I SAM-dependent methyltransferase [Variovorax sp. OV329]SFN01207.1 Methyltransferase domain-containing protein [Variovorax sp. OV329]
MSQSPQSFGEFEHAAWADPTLADKYHEHLSALTRQSIDALLNAAKVGPAGRVLDVATGAGYVADEAVRRGADATGIDFSGAQVEMARRTYPQVRFEVADAQALPYHEGSFDSVVNAFGMCHLPDPDLALREAFRVLKVGGWMAFTVWDAPERAVGFGAVYAAIRAHGSLDVGLPAGPNFFLFSDAEHSLNAMLRAGFVSPSFTQVPQAWHMATPDSLFDMVAEGTARAAATLRAQAPAAREAIRAALREAVSRFRVGDHYEVPMPASLAAAVKPAP